MVKRIEVDLRNQRLKAFDGKKLVHQFNCVTGDKSNPTVPGDFSVSWRDKNHISQEFKVPMHYALFFDNGKAIHQWHGGTDAMFEMMRWSKEHITDLIGSHGCVRLTKTHAATLFDWALVGTAVKVLRPAEASA